MEDAYAERQKKLCMALVQAIAKTEDVVADDYNPHFKSKFASLSAHLKVIKPIFKEHGLALIQMPIGGENSVGIKTIVIHEDGGSLEADCCIPAEKDMNGQEAGSVFSYLRRYALAAVAGVATDDDDANAVSQPKPSYTPKAAPRTAPKPTQSGGGEGGPWDVQIHFGKNAGVPLSALNEKQLEWYIKEYKPTGYNGKPPKDIDIKLREALDAIAALKGNKTKAEPANVEEEPEDEVPF